MGSPFILGSPHEGGDQILYPHKTSLFIATVAIMLIAAMTAFGCAGPVGDEPAPEEEEETRRGGTIVIGYSEEPPTLDAHGTTAAATVSVLDRIGDPVLERDPETGDFIAHIAEEWDISEDGKTLTLWLRDDVTFHSGTELNAQTLKESWERILEPGHEVALGRMGPLGDLVVEDDYVLRIEMEESFAPLMNWVSWRSWAQPVDPDLVREYGDDYGRNPGSIGPYRFDEWLTGQEISLVRNEDYDWAPEFYDNRGPAYPDALRLRYIMEDATRVAALETGEIHITSLPSTEVERFIDDPDFEIFSYPRGGVSMHVLFNHEREPMDDLRVRQALSYAIDKSAIIDVAADGRAEEAHGPLPPTMWGYWDGVEDISYDHDLERAGALLDDAGWTLDEGESVRTRDGEPLEITLYLTSFDHWVLTAEMLQAQWRELGVEVIIENYEWGTVLEYLADGRHHTALMGYSTSNDPDWLYRVFHSSQAGGAGINRHHIRNDELDNLVERQRYTMDPDERLQYAGEAQRFAVEQAVQAPIYILTEYVAVNRKVEDFAIDYRGNWLLHDMWLNE